MASFQAIAATSQTIIGLLKDACPREQFPKAEFELYHASNFSKAMEEGVSLFLYRLGINGSIRNLPPRLDPDGRRYRPSLPLDLYYLLTAWGSAVEQQQRLLGWAVRTLEDTPILPANLLNSYGPEPDVFHPQETVELICDPLSLADLANIWDKLQVNMQTSITYSARMVALDSALPLTEARLAQTRAFDAGKLAS